MNNSLSQRQLKILNYLSQGDKNRAVLENLLLKDYSISKVTVVRDLSELIENGYIKQEGSGPSTYYSLTNKPNSLPIFDLDEYFKVDVDNRNIRGNKFESTLFEEVTNSFKTDELIQVDVSSVNFKKIMLQRDSTDIKKELERFVIELSWKSSKIEGNTYTLLDTENLIKNNISSSKNTAKETQMILNHKYAFDYILDNLESFKTFSIKNLKDVHSIIIKDLGIQPDFREHAVGITGTKYEPIDNKYQIEDAINSLSEKLQQIKSPFIQAFLLLSFISYIQPFADGNKRTARLISNSILIANNYYPLSYRNVDEVEYKKALIIFYEQFNIYYFKQMFLDQYKFSMENYFRN